MNEFLESEFLRADQLIAQDLIEEAKSVLINILAEDPNFGKAHNHLGWIFERKENNPQKAEMHYKIAIETAPDYGSGYLGYIDRNRVAVGGHSYGAFMTANLLTNSDDYACGIARSGAYNRTLTPFGFQSEQRNYWDVPQVYNTMSPFMNAEKMKKPMLLIHGDADNNSGTFTMQTERYFQALKNLGAPVRMVLLPKESHGYQAKESILHTLWEQEQFLDKCLKKK